MLRVVVVMCSVLYGVLQFLHSCVLHLSSVSCEGFSPSLQASSPTSIWGSQVHPWCLVLMHIHRGLRFSVSVQAAFEISRARGWRRWRVSVYRCVPGWRRCTAFTCRTLAVPKCHLVLGGLPGSAARLRRHANLMWMYSGKKNKADTAYRLCIMKIRTV